MLQISVNVSSQPISLHNNLLLNPSIIIYYWINVSIPKCDKIFPINAFSLYYICFKFKSFQATFKKLSYQCEPIPLFSVYTLPYLCELVRGFWACRSVWTTFRRSRSGTASPRCVCGGAWSGCWHWRMSCYTPYTGSSNPCGQIWIWGWSSSGRRLPPGSCSDWSVCLDLIQVVCNRKKFEPNYNDAIYMTLWCCIIPYLHFCSVTHWQVNVSCMQ